MTSKPLKPLPTDLPIHTFANPSSLESFLSTNHLDLPGIYIQKAKKASNIPSITSAQAVEVMLMFGWIDGGGRGIDDTYFLTRYTPRRAKSVWSAKNVATVGRLMEAGKMRALGMEKVEMAKRDGRWDRAYGGPRDITVPADFQTALEREDVALGFFEGLKSMDRYSVLLQVYMATSEKSRAARIERMVGMLKEGRLPPRAGGKRKVVEELVGKEEEPKAKRTAHKKHANRESAVGEGISKAVDTQSNSVRRTGLRPRSLRRIT